MQYWARRLEQEIDGVMRIFGGVQQLKLVSCLSFTCAAFLVAMYVLICRNHLCEHSHSVTLSAHSMCRVMAGCASGSWAIRCIYQVCGSEWGLYLPVSGAACHCYLSMYLQGFSYTIH